MLFKNTTILVGFAEITASTNFLTVAPTIQRIEAKHLLPILGKELYNSLNEAYTAAAEEISLTTAQKLLLKECRYVIGCYLGYYFAPIGELKFSDAGLRRSETNSEKTAFQYQVTNFREACLQNGDDASENLLQFLETNKADYATWVSSTAFKQYRSLFITTAAEFNQLFPSHSPYRNYWAMRSKMADVEEQNIKPAISTALYDALKTKAKSTTPGFTAKEEELLFKLKKAIANFTVALAVPFLSIRVDANGITVATTSARTSRDADAMRSNATDNNISAIIIAAKAAGEQWLKDAINYLNSNAADFPQWEVEDTDSDDHEINNDLNGSFGL